MSITDPVEIANKFNDYYVSIADNILNENKYNGDKDFTDYLHIHNSPNNSMLLYLCDEVEVKNLIKSMHPKKATGPNSIPTEVLHMLADDICKPLSEIFNLSLSSGQHPDILKVAKTIPIFKKGSRLLVGNYRPISLLSNINKILEKIVFTRVYNFLEKNKCIYDLLTQGEGSNKSQNFTYEIVIQVNNIWG